MVFTNSDPSLIRFFLLFLKKAGTGIENLTLRVHIHENADAQAAELFWIKMTGAKREQFLAPVLKRHNPKTARKNTGESYHGCLRIDVKRSSDLYRKIEGWAAAAMSGG